MFGSILDVVCETTSEVRSIARQTVSPVTDAVEDVTGVSSNFQKDIIEDIAVDAALGTIFTKILG